MSRLTYLVDTSVMSRLGKTTVADLFLPLAARGEVAMCSPVAFEILFSARSADDHRLVSHGLDAFPWVDVNEADHRRASHVQGRLAALGQHRAVSLVDALLAALAERLALTVLHYDRDFELIAAVTGQPHTWIATAGSVD